jgi:hypothetical protein
MPVILALGRLMQEDQEFKRLKSPRLDWECVV